MLSVSLSYGNRISRKELRVFNFLGLRKPKPVNSTQLRSGGLSQSNMAVTSPSRRHVGLQKTMGTMLNSTSTPTKIYPAFKFYL